MWTRGIKKVLIFLFGKWKSNDFVFDFGQSMVLFPCGPLFSLNSTSHFDFRSTLWCDSSKLQIFFQCAVWSMELIPQRGINVHKEHDEEAQDPRHIGTKLLKSLNLFVLARDLWTRVYLLLLGSSFSRILMTRFSLHMLAIICKAPAFRNASYYIIVPSYLIYNVKIFQVVITLWQIRNIVTQMLI